MIPETVFSCEAVLDDGEQNRDDGAQKLNDGEQNRDDGAQKLDDGESRFF